MSVPQGRKESCSIRLETIGFQRIRNQSTTQLSRPREVGCSSEAISRIEAKGEDRQNSYFLRFAHRLDQLTQQKGWKRFETCWPISHDEFYLREAENPRRYTSRSQIFVIWLILCHYFMGNRELLYVWSVISVKQVVFFWYQDLGFQAFLLIFQARIECYLSDVIRRFPEKKVDLDLKPYG